jgi:site-specific DNA-cytosine methylase
MAGQKLNFDDPRSKLFFEYVRLLRETEPRYFLLENVKMKKEWQRVISELLGVEPIEINSALVSAQNRKRLYWTNIPNVTQPEDKNIYLSDILESGEVDREKSYCIDACYYMGGSERMYLEHLANNKPTRQSERRLMVRIKRRGHGYLPNTEYDTDKTPALFCSNSDYQVEQNKSFRKLTPIECERLQTLPDNYTEGVSSTQRYKMIGNGWTVDVIAWIFKGLKE